MINMTEHLSIKCNNQDHQVIMKKLQAPFPLADIEFRVGSTNADKTHGMALAYLTNRAIMERLDEVFEPFGWKNEFKDWKGKGVICGISILFNGEWVTKFDGADETDFEPTKGGLSDSMKRAAVQWGIGRYLYKLEATWVPIKKCGSSYQITQKPQLPSWALPGGEVEALPTYQKMSKHQEQIEQNLVSSNVTHLDDKKNTATQLPEEEICSCCAKETVKGSVLDYSRRKFGNPICYKCQERIREEKVNPKDVAGNQSPVQEYCQKTNYGYSFESENTDISF